MSPDEVGVVIELWRVEFAELNETWEWVQLFETRGAISGASNPHPHGQIWSSAFLPDEVVWRSSPSRPTCPAMARRC